MATHTGKARQTAGFVAVSACCICTAVSRKALDGLLEGSGQGSFRDTHPWHVARERLDAATAAGQRLPVLFATGDRHVHAFSHWAFVESIEVVELHRGAWQTRCAFEPLAAVHPIWEALDSVVLAPPAEQLHREAVEPVRVRRQPLDETWLHPYAICETPAFIAPP